MNSSYAQVSQALSAGADPDMLCMTCPWDRHCITPPSMTRAEVEAQIAEAQSKDMEEAKARKAAGGRSEMPRATLVTAMLFGGKDTEAQVCPVFAMRMRLPEGREIADMIKDRMQSKPNT